MLSGWLAQLGECRTAERLPWKKQPTIRDATTGFPAKWSIRNERRNSILMTRHYPDLFHARLCFWLVENLLYPIIHPGAEMQRKFDSILAIVNFNRNN